MVRVLKLLLPGAIFGICVFAQQPAGLATLDGRVADTHGAPLRKATMILRPTGQGGVPGPYSYRADSDTQGHYVFEAVEPGSYFLSGERAGYLQKLYRSTPHETMSPIALTAGQHITGIDLVLTRGATVSGQVFDAEGDAVAGISVSLLQPRYENGRRVFQPGRPAVTDETGKYQMGDLAAGAYTLSAGMGGDAAFFIDGMKAVRGWGGIPLAKTGPGPEYYMTTTQASTLQIAAGADMAGIDIHLNRTPAFEVKGKVTGAIPGHPTEQCRVALVPAEPFFTRLPQGAEGTGGRWGKDGSFDFPDSRFPPGDYYLIVTQSPNLVLARQKLTIAKQDIDDAVLKLQPLVELSGSVAIEGAPETDFGAPRPGNPPLTTTIQLSLYAKDGPADDIRGRIRGDGSFVIPNITPATYGIGVPGIGSGLFLKSAQLGSQDAMTRGIDINASTAGTPLRITLSRSVGEISGVVRNAEGMPAAGDAVTLVSEGPGISVMSGADRSGRFTLHAVPPGTYRIYAWGDLEVAQHYDPGFLKPYESRGSVVTVTENGEVQVTLTEIPAVPDVPIQ